MIFDFSTDDLQIINAALADVPYKYAAPLIAKINSQIQEAHNSQVDTHDMPSGQTKPKDEFAGD